MEITTNNFWTHPFTQKLPVTGKLALAYVVFFRNKGAIILEDMALFSGLDISTCEDWIYYINSSKKLPETIEVA